MKLLLPLLFCAFSLFAKDPSDAPELRGDECDFAVVAETKYDDAHAFAKAMKAQDVDLDQPVIASGMQNVSRFLLKNGGKNKGWTPPKIEKEVERAIGSLRLDFPQQKAVGNLVVNWANTRRLLPKRISLPSGWTQKAAYYALPIHWLAEATEKVPEDEMWERFQYLTELGHNEVLIDALKAGALDYVNEKYNGDLVESRMRFYQDMTELRLPPFERALLFSSVRGQMTDAGPGKNRNWEALAPKMRTHYLKYLQLLGTKIENALDPLHRVARKLVEEDGVEIRAEGDEVGKFLSVFVCPTCFEDNRPHYVDLNPDLIGFRPSTGAYVVAEVKPNAIRSSEDLEHGLAQIEVGGDYTIQKYGSGTSIEPLLIVGGDRSQGPMLGGLRYREKDQLLFRTEGNRVMIHGKQVRVLRLRENGR